MIKLIASDLDGTLIPEGTQDMEPGFMDVLGELLDRGYEFYAASGRQYANMKRTFADVADRIGFISENGSLAIEKGERLYTQEIPREKVMAIAGDIMSFPETEILLSGADAAYFQPRTEWYEHQLLYVLKNKCLKFRELEEIQVPIVKIAMYVHDFQKNADRIRSTLNEKYGDFAEFVCGGNDWLDMIVKNGGKGVALQEIMKLKGLSAEEVMVFGDNQNDVSMLELTPNSYAMEHAKTDVKIHAAHTCRSVTETLRAFLNES